MYVCMYVCVYIYTYSNVCCLNIVSTQSLHCKIDWNSDNLDCTLQFLTFLSL